MGFPKVASAFLDYTASATSEATDHAVSNLELYAYPQRTWRTTATGTQRAVFDFTTTPTVKGLFLNNGNFPQVTVEIASDSGFTTGLSTLLSSGSFPKDPRLNRRKAWLDFASNALGRRYLRVTPVGTPDGGASYYELGVAAAFATVTTLSDPEAPPRDFVRREARTLLEYVGGGHDLTSEGPPYLELEVKNPYWRRAGNPVQAELFAILDLGTAPFVLYENEGDVSHAYLVRRIDDMPIAERLTYFEGALRLREPI